VLGPTWSAWTPSAQLARTDAGAALTLRSSWDQGPCHAWLAALAAPDSRPRYAFGLVIPLGPVRVHAGQVLQRSAVEFESYANLALSMPVRGGELRAGVAHARAESAERYRRAAFGFHHPLTVRSVISIDVVARESGGHRQYIVDGGWRYAFR
jgi:hypothetical protein